MTSAFFLTSFGDVFVGNAPSHAGRVKNDNAESKKTVASKKRVTSKDIEKDPLPKKARGSQTREKKKQLKIRDEKRQQKEMKMLLQTKV
jgi:hypothetical protein